MSLAGITPEDIENKGRSNLEAGASGDIYENKALTEFRSFLRPAGTIFSSSRRTETERHSISSETPLAGITPELTDNKWHRNVTESVYTP